MMATEFTSEDSIPDRPTLGVVAISFNEERDLPGFIDNLKSWVDEIVIVDDGSTDATRDIAEAAGPPVRFIVSPRDENEYFSHQRNKGIDASTSDWLLHMDIDERVPASLAREIRNRIADPGFDAYRYRRLNFFLHRPMKGGGWQGWNLVHLAKREIFRFGGMFHEDCIVDASPERIGQLNNRMWHLNDDSYQERTNKSRLYCQEQVESLRKRKPRISPWQIAWFPAREFISKYLVKGGFRDGTPGLIFAIHAATAMFRACALLWDEQNRIPREDIEKQIEPPGQ